MSSKARSTEAAMCRLGRMLLHSVLTRLEIQDLKRLCGEFRDHVLAALVILGREIEWDVKFEVATGSGRQAQARKQEAIQMLETTDANGEPMLSLQSAREECNIDHHTEQQRVDDARKRAAEFMQQQAAQQMLTGAAPAGGAEAAPANSPA